MADHTPATLSNATTERARRDAARAAHRRACGVVISAATRRFAPGTNDRRAVVGPVTHSRHDRLAMAHAVADPHPLRTAAATVTSRACAMPPNPPPYAVVPPRRCRRRPCSGRTAAPRCDSTKFGARTPFHPRAQRFGRRLNSGAKLLLSTSTAIRPLAPCRSTPRRSRRAKRHRLSQRARGAPHRERAAAPRRHDQDRRYPPATAVRSRCARTAATRVTTPAMRSSQHGGL